MLKISRCSCNNTDNDIMTAVHDNDVLRVHTYSQYITNVTGFAKSGLILKGFVVDL